MWLDIFFPPTGAAIVALLAFLYFRGINLGKPLSVFQKTLLVYGFWFCLGFACSIAVDAAFRWPDIVWIAFTIVWGMLLGVVAWRRYKLRT